ncbi:MAG: hypothetical protein NXY57DRAFT_1039475 [Lentinula lateritia]|nr:MAG: hypothetical protein NXY57DRAFT_1039475 [Lentinula lateritia]
MQVKIEDMFWNAGIVEDKDVEQQADAGVEQGIETDTEAEQGVETDTSVKQGIETDTEAEQGVETDAGVKQGIETDTEAEQGVKTDLNQRMLRYSSDHCVQTRTGAIRLRLSSERLCQCKIRHRISLLSNIEHPVHI